MNEFDFYHGARIAFTFDQYGNRKYGLEDRNGKELCPKDYSFIHAPEFGHFLVEKWTKKNLLRPDGSLVLNEWFHHINCLADDGFFVYGNTVRKTVTTPMRYLCGVAYINGIYLFPMVYEHLSRRASRGLIKDSKPQFLPSFYGEKDCKPCILWRYGGVSDLQNRHLPPAYFFDIKSFVAELHKWVFTDLELYYRDCNTPVPAQVLYRVGDIVRAGSYIKATTELLKPAHSVRFAIASAHAVHMGKNDDNGHKSCKQGVAGFHFNSYFQVIDVFELNDVTQVLLLHIPPAAARFSDISLKEYNYSLQKTQQVQDLIRFSHNDLQVKQQRTPHALSLDSGFVKSMTQLVGFDEKHRPVPFPMSDEPIEDNSVKLSQLFHKLTQDDDIQGYWVFQESFRFTGVESSVCQGCVYSSGIVGNGEGCGRLFKASFRTNWSKGSCEYFKSNLSDQSLFDFKKQYNLHIEQDKSNESAYNLVTDFIDEELKGDVNKLMDFDYNSISKFSKYGDCPDVFGRSPLMRAIISLLFSPVFHGLNIDSLKHGKYSSSLIMNPKLLFDLSMINPLFTSCHFREVSPEMRQRGLRVTHLTQQLGNWWVMPQGRLFFFDDDKKYHGLGDHLLMDLHKTMTSSERRRIGRRIMELRQAEIISGHVGEPGFRDLVKKLYLEPFLDHSGRPVVRTDLVWCQKRDMTDAQYQRALNRFCDFCEEFIPLRTRRLVDRLKEILSAGLN